MIRYHYTLTRLADELQQLLETSVLVTGWTQSKDIAYLVFDRDDEQITLECDVRSSAGTILRRDTARRATRNSIGVFTQAYGQRVALVTKHPDDRIITIWLESCQLHLELFSAGSGNIVLVQDGIVIDALHAKQQRIGKSFAVRELPSLTAPTDGAIQAAISRRYRDLGSILARECCERVGVRGTQRLSDLTPQVIHDLHDMAEQLLDEITSSTTWYVQRIDDEVILAPIILTHGALLAEYTSTMQAISKTIIMREQYSQLHRLRESALKNLTKRIEKIDRTLTHLRADEERDTREHDYKFYADLLMAQPDLQRRDLSTITLINWHTNLPINIRLNPELSLLQNAQRYYEKSRSSMIAAKQRSLRIPALLSERDKLQHMLSSAASASSVKELQQLPLPTQPMNPASAPKPPEEKYRVFVLDELHTLYVGKSAANNDELTMKFARQQDWWFHVRGASGSHAVLRGVAGPKIPKQILEAAASITAYYSQARNASYVPVVYTQRKYVRKPKGANIGAVVIDREQTVMARPGLPHGADQAD